MDLLKDLDQLKSNPVLAPATTCRVRLVLNKLETKEANALIEALADKNISSVGLTKLLQEHGHQISIDTIRRHRRRSEPDSIGCQCP